MLRIGLTGGIGSGKTTVANLFGHYGIPVLDADEIARQIVEPGHPAYDPVVTQFGETILTENKSIDRAKLRNMVFNDPTKRKQLEAIIHPLVRQEISRRLSQLNAPYCIVVVPLLIESGLNNMIDRILVIDAPEPLQIERVMQRNDLPADEVKKIIQTQIPRDKRIAYADDVIVNDSDIVHLQDKVKSLHATYLTAAKPNNN